jgi:predicted nuclease of predicted toxin-antitoxin system
MRLLLETHFPAALARQLQRHGIDAETLQDWQGGVFRTAGDEAILTAAAADGRVLVTYDVKTIPTRLMLWAEEERRHAGVILVSSTSFPTTDIGRLLRALVHVLNAVQDQGWADRIVYLRPTD